MCCLHKVQRGVSATAQVSLNTVDNVDAFSADVAAGRWDTILPQVRILGFVITGAGVSRPLHCRWRSSSCRGASLKSYTSTFFWCVVRWLQSAGCTPLVLTARPQELCELSELDTARSLLRQSAVLGALKLSEPDRYLRLEHLLVEPRMAWPDAGARDARRRVLADSLVAEVSVVPAGRLLALLGQALKWQRYAGQLTPGASFDLLRGSVEKRRVEPEACVAGAKRASRIHTTCSLHACAQWRPSASVSARNPTQNLHVFQLTVRQAPASGSHVRV